MQEISCGASRVGWSEGDLSDSLTPKGSAVFTESGANRKVRGSSIVLGRQIFRISNAPAFWLTKKALKCAFTEDPLLTGRSSVRISFEEPNVFNANSTTHWLTGVAREFARTGDLDGALQDYSEAIRLKPDHATAFSKRGIARRTKGDLDGALQDYSEAIRLKPDYAAAFNNRGNLRRAKGDLDGALQDYSEAIRLKPDYTHAFVNRAIARRAKSDLDGALQDFEEPLFLAHRFRYHLV